MIVLLTITVDSSGARVTVIHYVPVWVRHPDYLVLPAGGRMAHRSRRRRCPARVI
jgi:hypothetical protein